MVVVALLSVDLFSVELVVNCIGEPRMRKNWLICLRGQISHPSSAKIFCSFVHFNYQLPRRSLRPSKKIFRPKIGVHHPFPLSSPLQVYHLDWKYLFQNTDIGCVSIQFPETPDDSCPVPTSTPVPSGQVSASAPPAKAEMMTCSSTTTITSDRQHTASYEVSEKHW